MIDILKLASNYFGRSSSLLETKFESVSTDTRKIKPGDLFIALKGENFDAFDFLEVALKANCAGVVYTLQKEKEEKIAALKKHYKGKTFVEVEDTLLFLQDLARQHISWWKNLGQKTVVVLTGSNGKTTNKEFLRQFFESVKPSKVLATEGNLNNHIGLPLTILRLKKEHEVGILEIGTNHPGEIKFLSEMSLADFCYITNVGDAHIEFFGSRENIFKEKSELYHFTKRHSKLRPCYLCNFDDALLKGHAKEGMAVTASSLDSNADFYIQFQPKLISILRNGDGKKFDLKNESIFEGHNKFNLSLCFILALTILPDKEAELVSIFTKIQLPANNRSNLIKRGDQLIYLDAYNANPSSMRASLVSFLEFLKAEKKDLKECLFVIGDMNELGEHAEKMHRDLGAYMESAGITRVCFVGRYLNYFKQGYKSALAAYASVSEIDKTKLLNSSKIIYLKGSRSIKLETLVM